MGAYVFYESMYGNTHSVAEEISSGLRESGMSNVACVPLLHGALPAVRQAALLVVGVPARRRARRDVTLEGLLSRLEPALEQVPAAAFDTRVLGSNAPSAAALVAAQLQGHGCRLLLPPEEFLIDDGVGPLHAGERNRARLWGAALAAAARLEVGERPAAIR